MYELKNNLLMINKILGNSELCNGIKLVQKYSVQLYSFGR